MASVSIFYRESGSNSRGENHLQERPTSFIVYYEVCCDYRHGRVFVVDALHEFVRL